MKIQLGQRLRESPGPILITGHTGFKGTWMTLFLEYLKVPVIGYSLEAVTDSLYDRLARKSVITENISDIRDFQALEEFIDTQRPSSIIHMAAQPIVKDSYKNPRLTFDVNVMGTVNLLDVAFKKDYVDSIIVVTSDKVYRNDNSGKYFVETDPLEGKDPYSASKVGTEAVITAWQQIQKINGGPKVVSVRAGNVIGGGDFAPYRLIPDLVRGYLNESMVQIRNPKSTRPWQHVFDTTSGYILTLEKMLQGEAITNLNFGPKTGNLSVLEIAEIAMKNLENLKVRIANNPLPVEIEAENLNLNSSKALDLIGWKPKWSQIESVNKTFLWWEKYKFMPKNVKEICNQEIEIYLNS